MLFSLYFLAAPSSVAAIRRTIQLHLQRGISDNCLYSLIYISILYKCYIEYIYADTIPFASSLHAHRCCVWRNMAKLPRSKVSLHSRATGERGLTFHQGRYEQHPYYGCCTLSGLPSESEARSFSQKLNVVQASLRE